MLRKYAEYATEIAIVSQRDAIVADMMERIRANSSKGLRRAILTVPLGRIDATERALAVLVGMDYDARVEQHGRRYELHVRW